jgi:hypothetical protein
MQTESPSHNKTEKHNSKLESNTTSRGGWNTEPALKNGGGQRDELSVPNCQRKNVDKATKAEGRDGVTSQPPKVGRGVDPRAGLVGQMAVYKTELPHIAEGGADQTELQIKGNAAATC